MMAGAAKDGAPPGMKVGSRVLVQDKYAGTIRFYGTAQFAQGTWVGVALDTEAGKNDGNVQGVQYFKCQPNHGVFVRPDKLKPEGRADTPPTSPSQEAPKQGSAPSKRTSTSSPSSAAAPAAASRMPGSPGSKGSSMPQPSIDPPGRPGPASTMKAPVQPLVRRCSDELGVGNVDSTMEAHRDFSNVLSQCKAELERLEAVVGQLAAPADGGQDIELSAVSSPATGVGAEFTPGQGGVGAITSSEDESFREPPSEVVDAWLDEAADRLQQRLEQKLKASLEERLAAAVSGPLEELRKWQ